jgi:hypothetical protein
MATIIVGTQILSENLGDGWKDNNAAADALAAFTERAWSADLAEFAQAGHEVEIKIDVQHNTSGASRSMSVEVSPWAETSYDLAESARLSLTDEGRIWELFANSPEAAELYEEE